MAVGLVLGMMDGVWWDGVGWGVIWEHRSWCDFFVTTGSVDSCFTHDVDSCRCRRPHYPVVRSLGLIIFVAMICCSCHLVPGVGRCGQ